ncbi:hypothetical protein BASA83_001163 [Batrachochytrium salamandrivorans]|nr:hypothetical protein BASA62_003850 [Batrachochytrium salamandrivorans]KAH9276464.1 hypothetical protein BASA83_001163 [Batrachochytrium salamandrivorans]
MILSSNHSLSRAPARPVRISRKRVQRSVSTHPVSLTTLLVLFLSTVEAANVTVLCKCDCAPNSTILSVPSCNGCTKLFCIDSLACFLPLPPPPASTSSLPGMGGGSTASPSPSSTLSEVSASPTPHGDELWSAVCFQRGSFKDEIMVYAFVVMTGLLLAIAFVKLFLAHFMRDYNLPGYQVLFNEN